MTPCEKLGYKAGDEFEVVEVDGRYFSEGEAVTLKKDDGSSIPLFSNGIDDWYMSIHKDVKPINNQEQPMTNLIARNNSEPFATEFDAKLERIELGLTDTHEVIQHGGGWVLSEKQSDAAVTLQPGDYIATKGLSEDDYHAVAAAFMAAGADENEYDKDDIMPDCWDLFGWDEDDGLAHWDSPNSFEGSPRQLTLSQILGATNAGVGVGAESTTESTTEEQPMPQRHLADQLEAALVALEHAQSEVDRLQSEYRAAYPKIHGEVAIKNHVSLEKWVAGDIVVSAISDYGFTAGKTYRLHKDEYGDLGVTDDVGDKQYGLESYANIDLFWHSRP